MVQILMRMHPPNYPGSFNYERQITVGSLDSDGAISSFSNVGSTAVDIFAPGGNILSTVPTTVSSTGYDTYNGTSMAAPHLQELQHCFWR